MRKAFAIDFTEIDESADMYEKDANGLLESEKIRVELGEGLSFMHDVRSRYRDKLCEDG